MADNETMIFDDEFDFEFSIDHIHDAFFVPAMLVLSIVGFASSVLCILAFGRFESAKFATRFPLQMLSVADVMYLFITICDCIVKLWNPSEVAMHLFGMASRVLCHSLLLIAVWLVLLIVFNRYSIAHRPDLVAKYCTPRRVKVAVGAVWIGSLVSCAPQCIEYTIVHDADHHMTYVHPSALMLSKVYFIGYVLVFHYLVCHSLPFLPTTFLLVQHIRRSSVRQPARHDVIGDVSTPAAFERGRRLEVTLSILVVFVVVVLGVAVITEGVLWVGLYVTWFDDSDILTYNGHSSLYMVYVCSKVIAASFKMFIYAAANGEFRRALSDVMRCRRSIDDTSADEGTSPFHVGFQGDTVEFSDNLSLIAVGQ